MDYAEAIRLALAGEQSGFSVLYEKTYRKKYYLALQYMKNETAAEDVVQEAYIRAFSKLNTLEDPEKFPNWLGMIVANTAKNALKKNNPILFPDIVIDDEPEAFEYQIEDDNIDHMPEIAYTREETRQLTHELLDSLSEEQRMCILMFHIESLSIKEIASELGCSENTVKSRLKYGRDNIKAKAEELQKKGYQLYSVAPLPLLLYLFQKEAAYMEIDDFLMAVGARIAERVISSCGAQGGIGTSSGVQKAVGSSIKAARSGFIHTVAGKVTVAIVGFCMISGTAIYGVSQLDRNEDTVGSAVTEEKYEVTKETSIVTVKEVQDAVFETAKQDENASGSTTAKNKSENNSAGSAQAGGGNSNSGNANGGNAQTAHQHVWKEHTATKQEWVPNIVIVPDYATQQVKTGSKIVCNCGVEFLTVDGAEEHGMAHVLAGEPSNYSVVPVYEEQTVQIGSHEEDQGHYETVSYVDYYYCDCGATK